MRKPWSALCLSARQGFLPLLFFGLWIICGNDPSFAQQANVTMDDPASIALAKPGVAADLLESVREVACNPHATLEENEAMFSQFVEHPSLISYFTAPQVSVVVRKNKTQTATMVDAIKYNGFKLTVMDGEWVDVESSSNGGGQGYYSLLIDHKRQGGRYIVNYSRLSQSVEGTDDDPKQYIMGPARAFIFEVGKNGCWQLTTDLR